MKNFSRTAFLTSLYDRVFRLLGKMLVPGLILAVATASATDAQDPIATKYHHDRGIAGNPNVIFFDDFISSVSPPSLTASPAVRQMERSQEQGQPY